MIEKGAEDIVRRLSAICSQCQAFNFVVKEKQSGLPCAPYQPSRQKGGLAFMTTVVIVMMNLCNIKSLVQRIVNFVILE
jgi:hypothetical protein